MNPFSQFMNRLCHVGSLVLFGRPGDQQFVKFIKKIPVMNRVRFGLGMQLHRIGEHTDAGCIPLFPEQVQERGSNINRKGDLVGMVDVGVGQHRVVHRRGVVDKHLTSQVGLLLIAFGIEPVGTAEQLPVDRPDRFAGIVQTVLGKLNTEAVKRAFMQPRDKSLHHLPGEEFKRGELLQATGIEVGWHRLIGRLNIFFYECLIGGLGYGADLFVNHLATLDEQHGWDIPDPIKGCGCRIVVNIQFPGHDTAFVFCCQFVNDGRYHAAGATPFGRQVNQSKFVALYDLLFKICIRQCFEHMIIL